MNIAGNQIQNTASSNSLAIRAQASSGTPSGIAQQKGNNS
jgi:hypothetical protein